MNKVLIYLAMPVLCAGTSAAAELPIILKKPYLGYFLAYDESRDFRFGVGGDGSSELFFKKDDGNLLKTNGCTLRIDYVLEERIKDRWVNRSMREDQFTTSVEATATPEPEKPISFTATYTGDTKVEVTHTFTRDGLAIRTALAEKTTENPVRVGVRIVVGDLYRHVKEGELDERDIEDKVEDSEVTVWPVGGSSRSGEGIDFDELDANLQKLFPKGATKVSLESDRLAEHEFTLFTADEDFGTFAFRQKKPLYHGFSIYWWPDPAKMADEDCRLVIEVD